MKNIISFLDKQPRNYRDTFKQLSKSHNGETLVESEEEAFSLDNITKDLTQKKGRGRYRSADAFYLKENKVYFIEFKNAQLSRKSECAKCSEAEDDSCKDCTKMAVRLKALESILALKYLTINNGLVTLNEFYDKLKFNYIVVFSTKKNPTLVKAIEGNDRGNREMRDRHKILIFFDLDRYLDHPYENIQTITDKTFDIFVKKLVI